MPYIGRFKMWKIIFSVKSQGDDRGYLELYVERKEMKEVHD